MSSSWWLVLEGSVPWADAETTLHGAMLAIEGLAGLLLSEFSEEAFRIERSTDPPSPQPEEVTA